MPSALNHIPPEIHCAGDYEILAPRFLEPGALAHIAGGSGQGITLSANRHAFDGWMVRPRLPKDMADASTKVTLDGKEFPHPIFLAPVAHQKLAHLQGELETARAAHAAQSCLVASTLSSAPLEEIARLSERKWFQLYFQPQWDVTRDLVRRAERSGYEAIVVTLDAPVQVQSFAAARAGFQMPETCIAANLKDSSPAEKIELTRGWSRIFQGLMRDAPTLRDVTRLQAETQLPIWIKGVLHPQDAQEMREMGIRGFVVSNHGGRALDGAEASLDALPDIRKAVGPDYPLLLDSGIRSGLDIFKALALGADAVLVGRLQLYALSVAGALGVAHMLKLLREELEICMALSGCASLADIRGVTLIRAGIGHGGTEGRLG